MNRFRTTCACLCIVGCVAAPIAFGMGKNASADVLDAEAKAAVIEDIASTMIDGYIYEDVARKMAAALRKNLSDGEYDQIADRQSLAQRLTKDLQAISQDQHLRIMPQPRSSASGPQRQRVSRSSRQRPSEASRNYGFLEVSVLEGNVGYIKLRFFSRTDEGRARADAAMALLADVNALIIDLGQNFGGTEPMIRHLSTYLFSEKTHLANTFRRGMDQPQERWTYDDVPGKRRPDMPVYILTSGRTFSAAESFTFGLKNNDRVRIVGERTRGGGHSGNIQPLTNDFAIFLPSGRTYNPKTDKGWEAEGIEPHVTVPYTRALATAHAEILQSLVKKAGDGPQKRQLTWSAQRLSAQASGAKLTRQEMLRMAGDYGEHQFWIENNTLYYKQIGSSREPQRVLPMGDGLYMLERTDGFRFRFEPAGNSKHTRVVSMYIDGREERNERVGDKAKSGS